MNKMIKNYIQIVYNLMSKNENFKNELCSSFCLITFSLNFEPDIKKKIYLNFIACISYIKIIVDSSFNKL